MTRCVVVGSGAREHALAHALAQSAEVTVTPGNDGIAAHGLTCVATPATELDADLFVIGPEAPLVEGLADRLRKQGKTVVGPGEAGAQLEGSKSFMKEFLTVAGVPTAAYGIFSDEAAAAGFPRDDDPSLRHQDRRSGRRQRRAGHRATSMKRSTTSPTSCRASPSAWPDARSCSKKASWARSARSTCSVTARTWWRWPAHRTTSAWAIRTRVRTRAGWAPTRRCRRSVTRKWTM